MNQYNTQMSTPPPLAREEAISAAFLQALSLHREGKLEQAETFYRAILDLSPSHPETHFNLGILAVQLEQAQAGLPHFRVALENRTNEEKYWLGYIGVLHLSGQPEAARQVLNLASKHGLAPQTSSFLNLWLAIPEITDAEPPLSIQYSLSIAPPRPERPAPQSVSDTLIAHFSHGRYDEAEVLARRFTLSHPKEGFFWKALGTALWLQGEARKALIPMLRAVELMPGDVEALCNLGVALEASGKTIEAEGLYRQALSIKPDHASALNNLGDNLRLRGQLDEARQLLQQALLIQTDFAEAHNNLGCLFRSTRDYDSALEHLNQALSLRPEYPEALINLGNVLQDQHKLHAAEAAFRKALKASPDNLIGLNNLGNLLAIMGQSEATETLLRRAIALKPDYFDAYSNLLFNLNYGEMGSPEDRLMEARRFGEQVTLKSGPAYSKWSLPPHPDKLRVGFVSGDFRLHPVGYFLENVLQQLAATNLELIAYSTQSQEDALTGRIRPHFTKWQSLSGLDDPSAAQHIHEDGVHILIDLSGHTAFNRLPMFAYKPAPLQISWLGYFATTGVAQIDYVLADPISLPIALHAQFTESIQYLPETRLCFSEPDSTAQVSELPALQKGYITFGSFQNMAKVSNKVLATWARILAALPAAHLRWQCKQFSDPLIVQETFSQLEQLGIEKHRITLCGPMPRDLYLAAHDEIDLILDTFPYPGGTTTCEALWMGVPTLTLAGNSMHSRQGASLLNAAGLAEWIVKTEADYYEQAITRAADVQYLANLRLELRERVKRSPLFDAKSFAQQFEITLWKLWDKARLTSPP